MGPTGNRDGNQNGDATRFRKSTHIQASRLLHAHQARSKPADSNDHFGRLLSSFPWTAPHRWLGQHAHRNFAGGERYGYAESVDGASVGRSDTPHGQPAVAFWKAKRPCSISVWDPAEHRWRLVSCRCCERISSLARALHVAFLSPDLHSVEAKDPVMHIAGRISGRHAGFDRVGGCVGKHRPARVVSIRHCLSVAVPAFPGDCVNVP